VEYIEGAAPKAAGISPSSMPDNPPPSTSGNPPPPTPGNPPPPTPGNPPLSMPDLSHVKIKSNIGRNMWKQELKNIIVDQLGMEALKYECGEIGNGFCCALSHSLFAKPIMSGEHHSKQEAEQNAAKKAYKEIEIMKKQ
jgi:hypothetical protein